ncbi:hypothetical protein [Streptomyces sp. NPDC002851]
MAKNKNRKQTGQQRSAPKQSQEQAKSSAAQMKAKPATEATPGDMPRKTREKRFGHN